MRKNKLFSARVAAVVVNSVAVTAGSIATITTVAADASTVAGPAVTLYGTGCCVWLVNDNILISEIILRKKNQISIIRFVGSKEIF